MQDLALCLSLYFLSDCYVRNKNISLSSSPWSILTCKQEVRFHIRFLIGPFKKKSDSHTLSYTLQLVSSPIPPPFDIRFKTDRPELEVIQIVSISERRLVGRNCSPSYHTHIFFQKHLVHFKKCVRFALVWLLAFVFYFLPSFVKLFILVGRPIIQLYLWIVTLSLNSYKR